MVPRILPLEPLDRPNCFGMRLNAGGIFVSNFLDIRFRAPLRPSGSRT